MKARRIAAVVVVALAGCRGREEPPLVWTAPSARPSAPAAAASTQGLPEGRQTAFGVPLPQRSRISSSTPDLAVADIPYGVAEVEAFLRARLSSSEMEMGPRGPIFNNAKIPGVEGVRLDVSLERTSTTSRVTFLRRSVPADVSPPDESAPDEKTEAPPAAARPMQNM